MRALAPGVFAFLPPPPIFTATLHEFSEASLQNPVRLHLTKAEWTKALIPSRAFGGTPGLLSPVLQQAWPLPLRDGSAPAVAR